MQPLSLYIYFFVLIAGIVFACIKYKNLDNGAKTMLLLYAVIIVSETIASISAELFKRKEEVYHFYSVAEIFLTTLYFLQTIKPRPYKTYVIIAAIVWPLTGAANLYFQPIHTLNTNMLIIESIAIIIMSLYALYKILLDERIIHILKFPYFWTWTCFLVLWSCTFFFWAFFEELVAAQSPYKNTLLIMQQTINITVYAGIAVSFLLYPKKVTA